MKDQENPNPIAVRQRFCKPKRANPKYVDHIQEGSKLSYRLNEEGYKIVAKLAAGGHSQASIASALGCSFSWITETKKSDPLLAEAIARGKGILEDNLVSMLYREAIDGKSVTAAIFLCKGILGMREVGPTDPNAAQPTTVVNVTLAPKLSDEEWQRLTGAGGPTIEHD